ncbi:ATP-binding casette family G25 [Prunus dulcis]|uniref:ATP-binding casette family G25 n=1 Tax=Prunus dulcis TaxID=3755 RepID=A0A4Y1RZ85_PRUDU|nr:ATP-binding casette family G25 [Prunus dulcis]
MAAEVDTTTSGEHQTPNRDLPSDHSPFMINSSNCFPITLKFLDVCYRVKIDNKLQYKGGCCFSKGRLMQKGQPGQEPEERTILHGITGMVSPGEILAILGPSGSGKSTLLNALAGRLTRRHHGTVLANGRSLTKAVLRRTGFVTQDDVLYPHLTVRETLVFCSLLRLPQSLSKRDKISAAESVISELGLHKCENTIIGNTFIRGVSGGERKRVSIGHEMLMNPSLLILDEPTSGLDSTAAHRLVSTLGSLAQKGRTIVTSMHQPSSRVYQMLESVLVLSDGKCLYFGKGSEAMSYFGSLGFSPSFPMNPADFLLDLANGVCQLNGVSERDTPNMKEILVSSYNTLLAPKVKAECLGNGLVVSTKENAYIENHSCNKDERRNIGLTKIPKVSTWFNQFNILLQRKPQGTKHEAFNSLRVFQDRLGLLFFISIFWGVLPLSTRFSHSSRTRHLPQGTGLGYVHIVFIFHGSIGWRLTMELILPTIFLSIAYWMAGLKPDFGAFLLTLLVLLGYVLVSQGLGLALGAAIMDAKQASTVATVTMLSFVLTGGYYVHKVRPVWLGSNIFLLRPKISSLLGCSSQRNHHVGDHKVNCKFVEQDVAGQISPVVSTLLCEIDAT